MSTCKRIDLKEAQRLLLLHKLEALALPPSAEAKEQGALAECLDRLEAERALEDAVKIYAALKDRYESTGARGPPSPAASGKEEHT